MQTIGFIAAFVLLIILSSKKVNLGLSLLLAALITGISSLLPPAELFMALINGVLEATSLQLMVIVALISGMGYLMKVNGDLEKMIASLNSLLNNTRVMTMLIPVIIGTLNVPGGAILSAPMVEKSGDKIKLDPVSMSAINIFFRHIAFLVYPLYTALIALISLLKINIIEVIKYNFFVMIAGIIAAYYLYFKGVKNSAHSGKREKTGKSISGFLSSFFPILVILVLGLVFKLPFHYSVLIGVLILLGKTANKNFFKGYFENTRSFIINGINYNLVFIIASLMAFKEILEVSGLIDNIGQVFINLGIPLPLLVLILSLLVGYLTGMSTAAVGIVTPILIPLLASVENIGVYAGLLMVCVNIGYVLSPLHLCLILSNQYFKVDLKSVYRKLALPMVIMIAVALIQVFIYR